MDDLNQQIQQILSDPQSMQQLQAMAASLGLGGAQNAQQQAAPLPAQPAQPPQSMPDLSTLLASLGGGSAPAPPVNGGLGGLSPDVLQTVGKLAPLLSQVSREDDSTRLLRALRPLLGSARQQKLDEAIKILQMMRLFPLLKNSGLSSLLF